MNVRRAAALAAVALCAPLAPGCGSGPDDQGHADAFIACFKAPGYRAAKPVRGQESLFALEADRQGYPNTPVNITQGREVMAAVFLVFFENEEKATKALDQIGRTTVGDIPPQQRGPTVIGYPSADDKAKTDRAVDACL